MRLAFGESSKKSASSLSGTAARRFLRELLAEVSIKLSPAFELNLVADPRLLTAEMTTSSLLERVDRVEADFPLSTEAAFSTGAGVVTLLVKGVE